MPNQEENPIRQTQFSGSFEELLKSYQELQLRVTRFSAVEQQMINIRNKLDYEITRHKRMHAFNKKALEDMPDAVFCKLVAEAVVDILEVQVGVVIVQHLDEKGWLACGAEGAVLHAGACQVLLQVFIPLCDSNPHGNILNIGESDFLAIESVLPAKHAYGIHLVDEVNKISLFILGGILADGVKLYDPLDNDRDVIFSVFSQQVLAQFVNRKKNKTIVNQVDKIETLSKRLSKITDNFLSFGSSPMENIDLLTKSCGELLKADAAIYTRSEKCLIKLMENNESDLLNHQNDSCDFCFQMFADKPLGQMTHLSADEIFIWHNARKCDFPDAKTYVGCAVLLENKPVSWLALVFNQEVILEENDKQIMKIISAGIAVEELRSISIENLRKNEQLLNSVVETQQEMICRYLPDTTLTFVNIPFSKVMGISDQDLTSKKMLDLIPEAFKNSLHLFSDDNSIDDYSRTFIHKLLMPDGNWMWQEWVENGIYNPHHQVIEFQAIGRDITERKIAEEILKSKMDELVVINKKLEQLASDNQELEQYAYLASHDLKEPLRTVENFIQLLTEDYSSQLDAQAHKYLDTIVASINRMNILIKTLLEFSRLGVNKKLTKVDCRVLLDEVIADLNSVITSTDAVIQISDMPHLNLYESEMRQLFQNLIANAIKFRKKDVQPVVKIFCEKTKESWQFSVRDNGIGIAPEHFKRVFEIFQRLHAGKEYEGSGIGLANCRKIVKMHLGEIWIESTVGEGTSFYFTIQNL